MAEDDLQLAVPFFRVADIAASLRFYVDGLGFAIRREWKPEGVLRWCWLERGKVALMLQSLEAMPEKPGEGVAICILCADALALYREFRGRSLAPEKPFVGNGLWVTSLRDPDGYRIDFESPTDAAEDSVYDDA